MAKGTMKALVKYAQGPGNMEIRDLPIPEPGPGQVKIRVVEAGICGSDLHVFHSNIAMTMRLPVATGHEFSGIVESVGEGVTDWKPGDRVVSETSFHYCGKCDFCREGFYNVCVERECLGYVYNGVFAKYTVVPADLVHRLPDNVSFTSGALCEPLACVVHAVDDLCHIKPNDVCLVSGPGAIGIMAAQVAKAYGATVILTGTSADVERLKIAKSLGIDYTVNIQEEELSPLVDRLTRGYGVDVVLECSGSAPAIDTGLQLIKKRGWYCQIGLAGKKVSFDIEKLNYKEIHVSGSIGSRNANWRMLLQLLESGKVNLEALVTHKMPLTDWEKAFALFEKKEGIKLVLTPVDD